MSAFEDGYIALYATPLGGGDEHEMPLYRWDWRLVPTRESGQVILKDAQKRGGFGFVALLVNPQWIMEQEDDAGPDRAEALSPLPSEQGGVDTLAGAPGDLGGVREEDSLPPGQDRLLVCGEAEDCPEQDGAGGGTVKDPEPSTSGRTTDLSE